MLNHSKIKEKFLFFFFRKFISPIERFLNFEASGGIFLLLSTLLALILVHSSFSDFYFRLIHSPVGFHFGSYTLEKSLQHWVNDGLMTLFFMVVGLEIKRELFIGELSNLRKAAFPIFAALGGMIVPALIYMFFNMGQESVKGWGVPMATDIAFAVGILSLMSRRVPFSLKIFLLALAIVDDLGAVLVIALFYTEKISPTALGFAFSILAIMSLLTAFKIRSFVVFIFLGFLHWMAFLKSGVHPTIAGVLLGSLAPLGKLKGEKKSPLEKWLHHLHPWVTFLIMPLFALTNAGIVFKDISFLSLFSQPICLGVFFGLVLGKPLGVFLFSYLSVRLKISKLPKNVGWLQILSVGMISGVGFTMAIFISNLAFLDSPTFSTYSKISIFFASVVSGVLGFILLFLAKKKLPMKKRD